MMFYEPGNYVGCVTSQGFQTAKTGRMMIVLSVRITHQLREAGLPSESLTGVEKAYDRTVRLVINEDSDKSMRFLLMKLRYAGFEGASFRNMNLVDSQVRLTCEEGQYNGQPSEQWDLMLPPMESQEVESDPKLVKKLDALFGRMLKDGKDATPKAEAPQEALAPPRGAPIPDDEVPF